MKNQLQLYLNRTCIIATLILFATCSPKKEYRSVKIEHLTFQYEREGVDTSFLKNFKVNYGLNEGFFGYYIFFYEYSTDLGIQSKVSYHISYFRFKHREAYPDSFITEALYRDQVFYGYSLNSFQIVDPGKKYIFKNSKNLIKKYVFFNNNCGVFIELWGDSLHKNTKAQTFHNFLTNDVVNIQVDTNKIKYVNTYNPNAKNGKNK